LRRKRRRFNAIVYLLRCRHPQLGEVEETLAGIL
jgi:hypothetical protein